MKRADHGKLMDRLRTEVAMHVADHGGRPPPPRIYRLRETYRRWLTERADYQMQIDGTETDVNRLDYARRRIVEIDEKITETAKLDLRTDEERRGLNRKDYVRKKDIIYRGVPDEKIEKIERHWRRQAADSRKARAEFSRLAAMPGTPERQTEYERRRSDLHDHLRWHDRARKLMAKEAIAERHGEDFIMDKYQRSAVNGYIEVLATLDSLDEEFADCETSYLTPSYNAGMNPDTEDYAPDPYDDAEDHCTPAD